VSDTATDIDRIMDPDAVAVVGASTDETKRGYQAIETLQEGGYEGDIYPVNPSADEIRGLDANRECPAIAFEGDARAVVVDLPDLTPEAPLDDRCRVRRIVFEIVRRLVDGGVHLVDVDFLHVAAPLLEEHPVPAVGTANAAVLVEFDVAFAARALVRHRYSSSSASAARIDRSTLFPPGVSGR